ncbi:peptidyl-prolyl cis-trans isomerase [Burkholderia sp. BE17]|nr:peptidyl-prolyl cis-trans isomerase [Burkholderia sp. BE17]
MMCAGAAWAADVPSAPDNASAVAARVNGQVVTRGEIEAAMQLARLPDTDAVRTAVTNDLIAGEVVRQAAEKSGYGDRPEVKRAIDQVRAKAESQLYLRDRARPAAVTDAQVKERYDAIVANLGDKEYKPRIISVGDDAAARTVLARLKQGRDFAEVAREYSTAPNKMSGGEMNWVSFKTPLKEGQTQGLPLPLAQALVKLSAGGVTPMPVQVGDARLIAKLDSVRPTQVPAFESVKKQIKQQLEAAENQRALAVVVDSLLKDAKVER